MPAVAPQLIKPFRWAVSPGLIDPNWRWAWRGLIRAWLFWEGGGAPADWSPYRAGRVAQSGGSWTAGGLGMGFYFDGTNDYLNAGSFNQHAATNELSVVMLFRATQTDSMVLMRYNAMTAAGGDYQAAYVDTNNPPNIRVKVGSAGYAWAPYALGDTVHIVSTAQGGGPVKIYKNGFLEDSATASESFASVSEPWLIGVDADATNAGSLGNWFRGDIYQILIYNRILSAQEVWLLSRDPFGPFRMVDEAGVVYATGGAPPAAPGVARAFWW